MSCFFKQPLILKPLVLGNLEIYNCLHPDFLISRQMNSYLKSLHNKTGYIAFVLISLICLSSPLYAEKAIKPELSTLDKKSEKSRNKTFNIHFFSLKRGHSIAPATVLFRGNGKFEITIDQEKIVTTKSDYRIDNFNFEADWEFVIKKNKKYIYIAKFKGLYLQDNLILGIFTLKEYIEPKLLTQEIPFLFWGAFKNEQKKKNDKPEKP